MLDHIGDATNAYRIRNAMNDVLHSGCSLTADLGGKARTTGFADAIIARLALTRVLHVSDLHFGPPAVPAQLDAIAEMIAPRRFDVVAFRRSVAARAARGVSGGRPLAPRRGEVSRMIVVPAITM